MDRRVWLKQQQRQVKLAYNKVQSSRDAYKVRWVAHGVHYWCSLMDEQGCSHHSSAQAAMQEGRQLATALADALITQQYVHAFLRRACLYQDEDMATNTPAHSALPTMPLGVLQDMPGLQEAAIGTLHHRQTTYITSLQRVVKTMQDAVDGMHSARSMLGCDDSDSNAQQLWQTQPVFVSYTMKQLGRW